jgi:SAM-dependent methyltransferase
MTGTSSAKSSEALPLASTRRPQTVKQPGPGGFPPQPATYSDSLLPVLADLLLGFRRILDPFAGTGKIHRLCEFLEDVETVAVEIEPEWAAYHPRTIVGNALALDFCDGVFDAICTSPTYGNRLADHHDAYDPDSRRTYTHDYGRPLNDDNSGTMQWGDRYRDFHERAWIEALRVLHPGGRFLLNIKDHIRGGEWIDLAGWHLATLTQLGLRPRAIRPVVTGGLRLGSNGERRTGAELVIALDKP